MVTALGIAYLVVGTLSFFLWAYGLVSFLVDVRRKVLPWLLATLGWGSEDDRDLRDRAGDGSDEGTAATAVFGDADADADPDSAPTNEAGGPIRPPTAGDEDSGETADDPVPRPDPDTDADADADRRAGTDDDADPGATPGGDGEYGPDSTSPRSDGGEPPTRDRAPDEG